MPFCLQQNGGGGLIIKKKLTLGEGDLNSSSSLQEN